jgi:hypothetical protein
MKPTEKAANPTPRRTRKRTPAVKLAKAEDGTGTTPPDESAARTTEASDGGKAPKAAEKQPKATSDAWTAASLGRIECRSRMVAIGDVLDRLPSGTHDKIKVLLGQPSIRGLADRMLGPDGRYTPVVFVEGDDWELLSGSQTIAAAQVAGIQKINVLLIAPSDAGAAQSILGAISLDDANPSEDDEAILWQLSGLND